jgi:hypothetical protein
MGLSLLHPAGTGGRMTIPQMRMNVLSIFSEK